LIDLLIISGRSLVISRHSVPTESNFSSTIVKFNDILWFVWMQFIYIVIMSWFSLAILLSIVIAYSDSELLISRKTFYQNFLILHNVICPCNMGHYGKQRSIIRYLRNVMSTRGWRKHQCLCHFLVSLLRFNQMLQYFQVTSSKVSSMSSEWCSRPSWW